MFDMSAVLDTDSYKFGHSLMLPENVNYVSSYGEARSDERWRHSLFFGLQAWLKTLHSVTQQDVEEARELAIPHCGVFNYDGWMRIVTEFGGVLPIAIEALPEGMIIPNRNALY